MIPGREDHVMRHVGDGEIDYCCSNCGVKGCKLWRQYQTFADHVRLLCAPCALSNQRLTSELDAEGKMDGKYYRTDQIGDLVPAVPVVGEATFWGYTSVPPDRVAWWRALPTYPSWWKAPAPSAVEAEKAGPAVGGDDVPANVLSRLRKDAEFTRDRVGAPGCQKRRDAMALIDILDTFGPAWSDRQGRIAIVRKLRDMEKKIGESMTPDETRCHADALGAELDELENDLGFLRADGSSAAD